MQAHLKQQYTHKIKQRAAQLGFDACGVARADFLEDQAPRLEQWLRQNMHGQMAWMANHFDKRLDPRKLVDGAKSVVSLLFNYYPPEPLPQENSYKVAKYAYGEDYHYVVKRKLRALLDYIGEEIGEVAGRAFVDSAPVLEKAWAERAGVGWVGKNSNLLNRSRGSFFFLAELVLDLELVYDVGVRDYCGSCTRCLDACPTQAITEPYVVDGSRCISYFTIELKEQIPEEMRGKFDDWIFGCDICQDVCPWNRFARAHQEPAFLPHPQLRELTRADWHEITADVFGTLFRRSAVKRAQLNGLRRKVAFVQKKASESSEAIDR